jgi:hypothetical protein
LDLTRIHSEQETWTPVEEPLPDGLLRRLDHLSREPADSIAGRRLVVRGWADGDVFEEHCYALHGLVA